MSPTPRPRPKLPTPDPTKIKARDVVNSAPSEYQVAVGSPERLQDCVMKICNRKLKQIFYDQKDFVTSLLDAKASGGNAPSPTNARQQLARLLVHEDNDTLLETLTKAYFLDNYVKPTPVTFYGLPISTYHDSVQFLPQIELYFRETDGAARSAGRQPVHSTLNIRVNQKAEEITMTDLNRFARIISETFGTAPQYKLKRGTIKCTYIRKEFNYQLACNMLSEVEGKEIFKMLLAIQEHTWDDEFFSVVKSEKNFSTPKHKMILGKSVRLPRMRPVADCLFRYATFKCHGLYTDVPLVDLTGKYPKALISPWKPTTPTP